MTIELFSPCKINLLLNILGRRTDGFHELETVLHPVPLGDRLAFTRGGGSVQLTCSDPALPVDHGNLVHRAAAAFLTETGIGDGVRIHLEKRLPVAAGLGGGSANAAVTLRALNSMFGRLLDGTRLQALAARLGSDVPFFLQDGPALATGRGECIEALAPFPALRGRGLLLLRPGFGVSTPWAYQQLARCPEALNGRPGRARRLIELLNREDRAAFLEKAFYNALEASVFPKHPWLACARAFMLQEGAWTALMSGSGSTLFAITSDSQAAEGLRRKCLDRYGAANWCVALTL